MDSGQRSFAQREFATAAQAFERAARADRGRFEGWVNLGVCQLELGQTELALDCLQRAALLAPGQGIAHQLLGDALRAAERGDEALAAYRRAVALAPSADAHNKLGCLLRNRWQLAEAEQSLRGAVQADPEHAYASVNLGTLLVLLARFDEARTILQAEMSKLIPPDAYYEAARALLMLDERQRLAPVVEQGFAAGDFASVIDALRATPAGLLEPDAEIMAFLEALTASAQSLPAEPPASETFGAHGDWPLVEAHFSLHRGDAPDAFQATRAALAQDPGDPALAAVARYARAVAQRRLPRLQALHDECPEAALRHAHWLLLAGDESVSLQPGHFKLQPNEVQVNTLVGRAAPERVVGTLRRFFGELLPTVANADARAGLLFMAIVRCHCFVDGNGRVARFLVNHEMERGGLAPVVIPAQLRAGWRESLFSPVYERRTIEPLLEFFAACRSFSARFMEQLA